MVVLNANEAKVTPCQTNPQASNKRSTTLKAKWLTTRKNRTLSRERQKGMTQGSSLLCTGRLLWGRE